MQERHALCGRYLDDEITRFLIQNDAYIINQRFFTSNLLCKNFHTITLSQVVLWQPPLPGCYQQSLGQHLPGL